MQISINSNYINDTEVGIALGVPAKKMDLRVGTRGLFFIGMRQCETWIESYLSPSCLRKPVSEGINAYVGGIKTQRLTKYRAILMDHILVHGPLCIRLRAIMA